MARAPAVRYSIVADDKTALAFRAVQGRLRSTAGLATKLTTRLTALAGIGGAAGFGAMIFQTAKLIDRQAKLSDQINITIGDLAALEHQGDLLGISTGQVDAALERMVKRLGDAASGGGPAKKTLEDLNLEAEKLVRLDAGEQYRIITERLAQLGTVGERTIAVTKIFGDDARNMVALVNDGAVGFNAARQEVEAFNAAISRTDAAKVEAAGDQITRIKLLLRGISTQVTVRLAEIFTPLAERFLDAARNAHGFRDQVLWAMEASAKAVAAFGDRWIWVQRIIGGVEVAFLALKAGVLVVLNELSQAIANTFASFKIPDSALFALKVISPTIGYAIEGLEKLGQTARGTLGAELEGAAIKAADALAEARRELLELYNAEPQAGKVEAFFAKIREDVETNAEQMANARARIFGGAGGGAGEIDGDQAAEKAAAKQAEVFAARLEQVRTGLLTEREALIEHDIERELIIEEAFQRQLINQQERQAMLEDLARDHQDKLAAIEGDGLAQREAFEQASLKGKASMIFGQLAMITEGVSRHNRQLFEINKIAGIANAIIATQQGAAEALKWGWPLGPIFAAIITAAGLARVAAISGTSYGGSSAGATVTPTSGVPPSQVGTGPTEVVAAAQPRPITIVVEKGIRDQQSLIDLVEQLNDLAGDNVMINAVAQ